MSSLWSDKGTNYLGLRLIIGVCVCTCGWSGAGETHPEVGGCMQL
jgi:hypothetical protein